MQYIMKVAWVCQGRGALQDSQCYPPAQKPHSCTMCYGDAACTGRKSSPIAIVSLKFLLLTQHYFLQIFAAGHGVEARSCRDHKSISLCKPGMCISLQGLPLFFIFLLLLFLILPILVSYWFRQQNQPFSIFRRDKTSLSVAAPPCHIRCCKPVAARHY